MDHHFVENLEDRKGVVSNLHCFVNRFLDTGFKTKWSGLWAPPNKFLDYYGIKVNGEWLDSDTLEATDYGDKMVFHHSTNSLEIKETIEAPETISGATVTLEIKNKKNKVKAVKLGVELGVDIRHKDTDIDDSDYKIDQGPGRISFKRNDLKLLFSSKKEFELNGEGYEKEHRPGELQKCFVPGEISFKTEVEDSETINFDLSTPQGSFGDLEDTEQELENEKFGYVFSSAIDSMENLVYDKSGIVGVIAGHPWFQSFWARDSFWTVLGLIDAGHFQLSEDILTAFAEHDLPDKIVLNGEDRREPKQYDTEPLYIIAAEKLRRHYRTNEKIDKAVKKASESLEINGKTVSNDPCGTWMDTTERPKAVDIQSLWMEAMNLLDDPRADKLEEGLKEFKTEEYMKDSLKSDTKTINPAIPLMFDQLGSEASKFLETVNGEFSSRYGGRTVSMTDRGYESSGYHNGSVWGLTTCWASAANLTNNNEKQGINFLHNLAGFVERNQPGAYPENVDAENGELLGCSEQAWSAGMIVHVIDSYLLGIEVKNNKVRIDPPEDFSCKRLNKKVKDTHLDLEFKNGDLRILNEPDIEVKIV